MIVGIASKQLHHLPRLRRHSLIRADCKQYFTRIREHYHFIYRAVHENQPLFVRTAVPSRIVLRHAELWPVHARMSVCGSWGGAWRPIAPGGGRGVAEYLRAGVSCKVMQI